MATVNMFEKPILVPEQPTLALRDQFAMAALPACLSDVGVRSVNDLGFASTYAEAAAKMAYEVADAMMKQREA